MTAVIAPARPSPVSGFDTDQLRAYALTQLAQLHLRHGDLAAASQVLDQLRADPGPRQRFFEPQGLMGSSRLVIRAAFVLLAPFV